MARSSEAWPWFVGANLNFRRAIERALQFRETTAKLRLTVPETTVKLRLKCQCDHVRDS